MLIVMAVLAGGCATGGDARTATNPSPGFNGNPRMSSELFDAPIPRQWQHEIAERLPQLAPDGQPLWYVSVLRASDYEYLVHAYYRPSSSDGHLHRGLYMRLHRGGMEQSIQGFLSVHDREFASLARPTFHRYLLVDSPSLDLDAPAPLGEAPFPATLVPHDLPSSHVATVVGTVRKVYPLPRAGSAGHGYRIVRDGAQLHVTPWYPFFTICDNQFVATFVAAPDGWVQTDSPLMIEQELEAIMEQLKQRSQDRR